MHMTKDMKKIGLLEIIISMHWHKENKCSTLTIYKRKIYKYIVNSEDIYDHNSSPITTKEQWEKEKKLSDCIQKE